MKILLITDSHCPRRGGAEKYFFQLKNALKQQNMNVISLGFDSEPFRDDNSIIFNETPFKAIRQWWRMFLHPVKYLQLRRCIKKINPDVIHIHNIKKYTIALLKALEGFPVIQTVHDYSPICPTQWNLHTNMEPCATGFTWRCYLQHRRQYSFPSYLALTFSFWRMKKLLQRYVHAFVAPSPALQEYLVKQGYENVYCLPPFQPNSFNNHHPHPSPLPQAGEGNNSPFSRSAFCEGRRVGDEGLHKFLFIGQLEKQKGIYVLIQEFALACAQHSKIHLIIAGEGKEKSNLIKTVNRMGLSARVTFTGWIYNPTPFYTSATALIFPSLGLESFGLVLTEAMQAKCPIIATQRGSNGWIIEHEKTGLLFDPLKPGELANNILRLANHLELAKEMGQHGFNKLNELPNDEMIIAELMKLYYASIATKKAPLGRLILQENSLTDC